MSGMSPIPPSVSVRIENSGSRIPARRRRRCASFLHHPRRGGSRLARRRRIERLAQHRQRPPRHLVRARAGRPRRLAAVAGVELEQPRPALRLGGQLERDRLVVRVHQDQQAVVEQPLAALVGHRDRVAAQHHRQRRDPRLLPVLRRHLRAVGPQPGEILRLRLPDEVAHEEPPLLQDRMRAPQPDQPPRELEQPAPPIVELPVGPGDLVVLAVGVVVAALGAPDLVAAQQHRHALRQEQRRQQVPHLPVAQRDDPGIVGLALGAVVPGLVVVRAVLVVLAVRLVVLVAVADEIVQREAVVRGDEVDARLRVAPLALKQIRGARQPVAELRGEVVVPLPVAPGGVAVAPVQLVKRIRESCRPGSRRGRRPTAPRSASRATGPDPAR